VGRTICRNPRQNLSLVGERVEKGRLINPNPEGGELQLPTGGGTQYRNSWGIGGSLFWIFSNQRKSQDRVSKGRGPKLQLCLES